MTERTCAAADLARALKGCSPGDTLTVDGDITRAKISGLAFAEPGVRLVGRFVGYNLFSGVAGLSFGGEAVETAGTTALAIKQSARITVAGLRLNGQAQDDTGKWKGLGLQLSDVAGYCVEDVEASQLGGAISVNRGSGVLRRLKLHEIAEDGLHLYETSDITVEDLDAADFQGQGHPDVVQVFDGAASAPMRNLAIRRVTYRRGTGGAAQGVFLKAVHPMEAVLIEDCAIFGSMYNAVHVDNAIAPQLVGNFAQGTDMQARVMLRNCQGGTLKGNTANAVFALSSTDVVSEGNVTIPQAAPGDESRLSAFLATLAPAAAAPAPDPRDATIADLKAQVEALGGELADAKAQIEADAKALAEMTAAREAAQEALARKIAAVTAALAA